VEDSVIVTFTDQHLVIRSKNLPNHPTAVFPDRWRLLDGNPNYIQEQDFTFHIPLEPQENPRHVAMDPENRNQALPGGPIGVMANGVIFHNPFDERINEDAVWRLDRCCGHPSPIQRYHYHQYPVCMNTPWDDQGEEHSPLLGFAFDGFPLYGPYEGKGVLAKDSRDNPLNDFNVHYDKERGWHYHVTPGKFPHLIGGFWGEPDPRNRFGPGPGGPMPPRPPR
ncbi:MAG: YHYH protein, partial [Planctomycetaceae bacterium]